MYKKKILLRFGDLMLKGDNIKFFKNKAERIVKDKFFDLDVEIEFQHDRVFINPKDVSLDKIEERLNLLTGFGSYSYVYLTDFDYDNILNTAIELINNELVEYEGFKIQTKRTNKKFKLNSQEFTQYISPLLLKHFDNKIKVDVKNPKHVLNIEIKERYVYLYLAKKDLIGGLPVGSSGKLLSMISGGIDSPVASFLAIKKGVNVELLHFESTPLTPIESIDKVVDLSRELAKYMPGFKIKLNIVPFRQIHEEILKHVHDSLIITVMRRCMYKIAEKYANYKKIKGIVNGESIGQVASQTLDSVYAIEQVTRIPIFRPLSGMDKNEIIKISESINCFNTSIKPFEDCCTVYLPKNPATKPKIKDCEFYESKIDLDNLIEKATHNVYTLVVDYFKDLKVSDYSLTFEEFKEVYKND